MAGLFGRPSEGSLRRKRNADRIRRVRKLVRGRRYDEALAEGLEYLADVPHNHDVLFIVGGIYHMRGRHREALEYLGRAAEIGEYDVDMLLLKANSHRALGEDARAAECCRRILEVDGGNRGARELLGGLDL